ncbi:BamA/TamA family outer membrane protein [Kaarinaea lacus]
MRYIPAQTWGLNKTFKTVAILVTAILSGNLFAAQDVSKGSPDSEKTEDSKQFVAAPLIFSAPAFGNGLGAMALYFYKPDAAGEKSPPSTVTMVGAYSDTDSYFLGIFNQNHLRDDHWRPRVGYANGKINNNFDIPVLGEVRFSTDVNAVFGRLDWRWRGNTFVGGKAGFVDVRYKPRNTAAEDYFEVYDVQDNASGQFGFIASYDSRDHTRYPSNGIQSEISLDFVPEWLGSKEGYRVLQMFANHYQKLQPDHILALRAYGRFTPSGTPYVGLSTLGQRSDLRGYTAGEKVAENLISTQAEYRWMFKPQWGVVGFGGVATLYDGSMSNIDSDNIYFSGGLGLRYVLHKENRVNFRVDFAWGEDDDSGYYVSMMEAF